VRTASRHRAPARLEQELRSLRRKPQSFLK
jgi:hypothetical protein